MTADAAPQVPLAAYDHCSPNQRGHAARAFADMLSTRRTVRMFSDEPVEKAVLLDCLRAANSAPSGANLKPWQFVLISSADAKRRIREAAEDEERAFYSGRAPQDWIDALAPIGTDARKPFLEHAPYLIAVFYRRHEQKSDGSRDKTYYAHESTGIATGILLAALHAAGLATLTHTPAPMGFLSEICERPKHERPYMLVVTGVPAENCTVPQIRKAPLSERMTEI